MLAKTTILATTIVALLTTPTMAQSSMDHSAHAEGPMADYMAAMNTMMASMDGKTSSGSADADFLLMMIPHHQSAIDIAKIELKQGRDHGTRDMAELKLILGRLGVKALE